MKRFGAICIAVTVTLCSVMFAGCGNKNAGSGSEVSKVTVWSSDGSAKSTWEELVNNFNETTGKEKGIQIDWVTYNGSELGTVVDVAHKNGQLPEICNLTNDQAKEYISSGDVIAIEDIEGGAEYVKEYDPVKLPGLNYVDGKFYSLPTKINTTGLIYNKDLFKKAGIVDENGEAKPPTTLSELREDAKKLTDASKGIYGYSLPIKGGLSYIVDCPMTRAYGANVYDYDNFTVSTEAMKKKIEFLKTLKEDGSLLPGADSIDNDTSRAYFAEGIIGMMAGVDWDVGVLTTQFVAKCDWDVVPYPTEDNSEAQPSWVQYSGGINITKNAKNISDDKILEVYKFIHSENTRKTFYERGIVIPCKNDAINAVDESKLPIQLVHFAHLYTEGQKMVRYPSLAVEGDSDNVVWKKVFSGTMSADDAEKDLNKRYSEALKKSAELGEFDVEWYK